MIKYFHTTVPHSGTRYINQAVEQATGHRVIQTPTMKKWEEANKPVFVFAHVGQNWMDFVEWGIDNAEKSWMTIRSPIGTWSTHWGHVQLCLATDRHDWKAILGKMRGQWEAQLWLLDKYPDLHIHPVESDIDDLGEYLGLDLSPDQNRYSKTTAMKAALRERDVEKINALCHGTDFFECFRDSITPDIRDLYEKHGYDIWWT